jgi:serine/threonine-protein phosphatase 2A regulatory subunit A
MPKAEDPNPLDLLKEELTQDEAFLRVNAVHRILVVATILGPEATRRDLLPFLNSTRHIEQLW